MNIATKKIVLAMSLVGASLISATASAQPGSRMCAAMAHMTGPTGQVVLDATGMPALTIALMNERAKAENNDICEHRILPELVKALPKVVNEINTKMAQQGSKIQLDINKMVITRANSWTSEKVGEYFNSVEFSKGKNNYPDIADNLKRGDTYMVAKVPGADKMPHFMLAKP
jgi:apolipoprotein N-acyltransferase